MMRITIRLSCFLIFKCTFHTSDFISTVTPTIFNVRVLHIELNLSFEDKAAKWLEEVKKK